MIKLKYDNLNIKFNLLYLKVDTKQLQYSYLLKHVTMTMATQFDH